MAADTALLDTAGIRRLAHAIDHGHTVTIHYTAGSAGSKKTAEHTVHALELDPPYLHALTTADDEPLSLHLADVRDAGLQP